MNKLAQEAAGSLGYEVDDIELLGQGRRRILRVTIDREGGITVDDCADYSRQFGALLDVEDPIPGAYTLEVSSPGLDRPLKKLRDYQKSVGKLVRVVLKEKMEGQGFLVGRLMEVKDDRIRLSLEDREKDVELFYDGIKKARLEVEI